MTKEEQQQITELIKKEKHSIDEHKKWSNELKKVENNKDYDTLDRFDAFKGRIECEQVVSAKSQQILAYMNIQKNIKEQEKAKKESNLKVTK